MAIFRCPSASLISIPSTQHLSPQNVPLQTVPPQQVPSQHVQPQNVQPQNVQPQTRRLQRSQAPSRRIRAADIPRAEAAARNAIRLARARRNIPADSHYGLFIGNFPPDTDKQELEEHFRRCGKITSTDIRCCGGVCTLTRRTPGVNYHDQRVRQYALMTFATELARTRALKLGGSVLRGYPVAVSLSICNLPELRQMIAERMNNYRSRFVSPDVHRAKQSVLKSLDVEPTVLLDPNANHGDRKRANAVILNHSFRMAVI